MPCPGGIYDRSPCGAGTSAKAACPAADGLLAPGDEWFQESIIGSIYRLTYTPGAKGGIVPTITGAAYLTAISEVLFNPSDPYVNGIHA